MPHRGRLTIGAIGLRAPIIPVGKTKTGALAMGSSIKRAYTWRRGVAIGKFGSNVLGMHSSHYCCGDTASEAWKLNKVELGDRAVKRWKGGKVVGKVTRIVKNARNIKRLLKKEVFTWGGDKRFGWIIKCTKPDGKGHYKTSMLVKIRFGEPKATAGA